MEKEVGSRNKDVCYEILKLPIHIENLRGTDIGTGIQNYIHVKNFIKAIKHAKLMYLQLTCDSKKQWRSTIRLALKVFFSRCSQFYY